MSAKFDWKNHYIFWILIVEEVDQIMFHSNNLVAMCFADTENN